MRGDRDGLNHITAQAGEIRIMFILSKCERSAFARQRVPLPSGAWRPISGIKAIISNIRMSTRPEVEPMPTTPQEWENRVDVLGIAFLLLASWRRIFAVTIIALVLGAILAFLMKPVYTATALILPPHEQQSSASTLLGSLVMLGGGGGASSLLKSPSDMYIGILQSQTIADDLIERFHLQSIYKTKTLQDTRLALEKHADFESKKDGLIHINVKDHSPQRAAGLANGFIDALYRMNSSLAITDAAQRRLFFSQAVDKERIALDNAENNLAATQVKTGLIQLNGQAELILRTIAQVQAQISSDEVALQGLLTSSTEQNPDVQRLTREIAALRGQLGSLQNSQQKASPGNTQIPAGRVPSDAMEYARKLREVKYHEALFDLLSKQYEAARIDEAKSAPVIQVIDHAVPPDKKSGPARLLIILAVGFAGFLGACLLTLVKSAYSRLRATPEFQERIKQLQSRTR